MPNPNRNLDKEITEGLARSEKMIRRQRTIKWMVVLIVMVVVFMALCAGVVITVFVLNNLFHFL